MTSSFLLRNLLLPLLCLTSNTFARLETFNKTALAHLGSLENPKEKELNPDETNKLLLDIPQLDQHTLFATTQKLFTNEHSPLQENTVLNGNGAKDLEVACGNTTPENNLISLIDRTQTMFGKVYLNYALTSPLTSFEKLQARTQAVLSLAQKKEFLQKQLDIVKKNQNNFLFLYQEETPFNKKTIDSYYFSSNFLKGLNNSPAVMEAYCARGRALSASLALLIPVFRHFVLYYGLVKTDNPFLDKSENKSSLTIHKKLFKNFVASWLPWHSKSFEKIKKKHTAPKVHIKYTDWSYQYTGNGDYIKTYEGGETLYNDVDYSKIDEDPDFMSPLSDLTLRDRWDVICKVEENYPHKKWRHIKKPFLALNGFSTLIYALGPAYAASREKAYKNLTNYLQEQLIGAAAVITAAQNCSHYLKKHPVIENGLTYSAYLHQTFDAKNTALSAKLHKLIDLLQSNTFAGDASYFSLKGRVLAAYSLMKEIQEELSPLLVALGEVDTLVATAQLFVESQETVRPYTIPTFIQDTKPSLFIEDVWNPFVGPAKSIPNSIQTGTNNYPANAILTGPNAGGKSTFLKGITLSILMAQTLGIVPAKSLVFTPFAKINTYMNISDDTAGGNSLFKSEVLRAQQLLAAVDNLKPHEFSFTIMDEMFSGTSPKEGEAAGYAVAKNLGQKQNSILLLATHFPKITSLDQTPYFVNYKVCVVRHENGTFSYPFKVEQGITDQNVALDILEQQGFNSSILSDAQDMLKTNTLS